VVVLKVGEEFLHLLKSFPSLRDFLAISPKDYQALYLDYHNLQHMATCHRNLVLLRILAHLMYLDPLHLLVNLKVNYL
jgi:hypothetical protein